MMKIVNGVPCLMVPVPLATLMQWYSEQMPIAMLPPVVIVPPLSEASAMNESLADIRQNGLPTWVVPLTGDEEDWGR